MVVCKCRKATRLYCFVHKAPVCGECICFSEHQICVVKKYSDWVIDGEYDWPPTCSFCNATLEEGKDQTTRLGCLHLMHTSCLVSHIKSFPPQTAPAGYVCPTCSTPIWPPVSIKDTGSRLHSKLKEAIIQSDLEKNVFGNHVVSSTASEHRVPPAFTSDPLVRISVAEEKDKGRTASVNSDKDSRPTISLPVTDDKYFDELYNTSVGAGSSKVTESEIIEVDGPNALENQLMKDQEPLPIKTPGATTRKPTYNEKKYSETSYHADDEDGTNKKYTRRGPFRNKFLRMLLPFWSNALPTLPVTAPTSRSGVHDGKVRHQKSSRMDPRKILLIMAIMACMATMGILYYRLAQSSLDENTPEDELQ
ncbi:zinc finger protein-like 1 [Zingiber officinale]|uniref:zinc finger protein-like 1 n=1 Tax=Zingiber officinale TaxID=94328 RepID=UPI001C4AD511|nr:zinc finger protein-like 1 [Zingiber officinale]